jgi:phosphatidylserine/phosphatidylglycerophosphate/cardiolipin synthase-like enzyme
MLLRKIKSKKYKKYRKKIWKTFFYFLCLSLLLIFLSRRLASWQIIQKLELPSYLPEQSIKTEKKLEAEIYFNNKPETNQFTKIINQAIDSAQESIEVAMYSFNLENLRNKIYQASERGVEVTLILDIEKNEQHNMVFENVPPDIIIIKPQSRSRYSPNMHHKFAIFDRGTSQEKLIAGSLNWTELQEFYDPSFLFLTTDSEIIQAYGFEMDILKQGIRGTEKFKTKEYKPWFKNIIYNDCFVDVWFSPGPKTNSINQRIADLIKEAQENIKIMIWQISDQNIAYQIIEKAKQGVNVQIIAEDYNFWERNSRLSYFLSQRKKFNLKNLEIINDAWRSIKFQNTIFSEKFTTIEFNPFLHHHTLIIDDQIVLFGTNNWSSQAYQVNDEDIIITDNSKIVEEFLETFEFHYQDLRGEKMSALINQENLIIENKPQYNNQKIMAIISQFRGLKGKKTICFDQKIEKEKNNFVLPQECIGQALNIFVYNPKNFQIIANALLLP